MVGGIGSNGGGAMESIRAALQRQADAAQRLSEAKARLGGESAEVSKGDSDFGEKLKAGIRDVNEQVQLGDELVEGIVSGEVSDFHEVAAQIKQADLSFKFTLAVRNKFVDAYREIMRMSV